MKVICLAILPILVSIFMGCAHPVKNYQSPEVLHPGIKIPISTIAVIPSGPPSVLQYIEPVVQQELYNLRNLYKRMRIIDRANLQHILNEQSFQHAGLIDISTGVKIGKIAGAQSILTYQIQTTTDEELEAIQVNGGTISSSISAKLILVETGEVIFQTTSFNHRQIDPPNNYGKDRWSEGKLWRIQSVELAGEQAIADFEIALLWGNIGWYIAEMPAGRTGAWVKKVYPSGRANLAGIQPNDIIFKIETPNLPSPKVGFWVVESKESLLDKIYLPTDDFIITLNRKGKSERIKVSFFSSERKQRACATWLHNPDKYGLDMRLISAMSCNTNDQKNEVVKDEIVNTINYLKSRLQNPKLSLWKEELILTLEDIFSQNPQSFLGMDQETQFQTLLDNTNKRLKASGRAIISVD